MCLGFASHRFVGGRACDELVCADRKQHIAQDMRYTEVRRLVSHSVRGGGRDQNQPRFLGMKTATFFECVVQLLGNV